MKTAGPPARRRTFLRAEWRCLLMLDFEVERDVLAPLVPIGTALDLFDGRALVTLVGFRFLRTRLFGVPVPLHRAFDEVNLRFYVRRVLPSGEVRRGVTFVRELVPRRAVALIARAAYNEPYRVAPMRSTARCDEVRDPGHVSYEWRASGVWRGVAARATGAAAIPDAGSESAFVTGHYWGYTRQRNGGTIEYEVRHPPWRVWPAADAQLSGDVASMYGESFRSALSRGPVASFIADGSEVAVSAPRRIC